MALILIGLALGLARPASATTSVSVDGCTITITVRIEIFGASATGDLVTKIEEEIEACFPTGHRFEDWCLVSLDAQVQQRSVDTPPDPDFHQILVLSGDPMAGGEFVSFVNAPLPVPNGGDVGTGTWGANEPPNTFAHEALHLMGLEDEYDEGVGADGKRTGTARPGHEDDKLAALDGHIRGDAIDRVVRLAGVACPPPCCAALDKDDRGCVTALNEGGRQVARAQGLESARCVKDAAKGKVPSAADCVDADAKGRVEKKREKLEKQAGRKCADDPPFADTDACTQGAVMTDLPRAMLGSVLGTDVDAAIVDAAVDKDAARCQATLVTVAESCLDARLKTFNRCKAQRLKGTRVVPPAQSSADLEGCLANDPKDKLDAACAEQPRIKAGKKCTKKGVDLDVVAPGCAGHDIGDCIDTGARCFACVAITAVDALATSCDTLDDGVENGSCVTLDPLCGNGSPDSLEECDDGNRIPGDGCSGVCTLEAGYDCDTGAPTACTIAPRCGNYLLDAGEECDCAGDVLGPGATNGSGCGLCAAGTTCVTPGLDGACTCQPVPDPGATPTPTATANPPTPTASTTPTPTPTSTAPSFTCTDVHAVPDPNDPTHGHVFDGGMCNASLAELVFVLLSGSTYTSFTIPLPEGVFSSTNQPFDTVRGTNPDPAGNLKDEIAGARFSTAGPNPHTVEVTAKNAAGDTFQQTVPIPAP